MMDKLSIIIKENAFASCSAQNFPIKKTTKNFKKEFYQKVKIPRDIPLSVFLSVSVSSSISQKTYADLTSISKSDIVFKFSLLITLPEALESLKGHRPFAKSIPNNEFHLFTWEINVGIKT